MDRSIERKKIEVWWWWWLRFNPLLGSVSVLLTLGCSWPSKFLLTTLTGMYADNMFVGWLYVLCLHTCIPVCWHICLTELDNTIIYIQVSIVHQPVRPSPHNLKSFSPSSFISLSVHNHTSPPIDPSIHPSLLIYPLIHPSPHHPSPLHHHCFSVPSSPIIISIYLIHSVDSYDNAVGTPSTTPTWS